MLKLSFLKRGSRITDATSSPLHPSTPPWARAYAGGGGKVVRALPKKNYKRGEKMKEKRRKGEKREK